MKVSKILISLVIVFGSLSVNSQDLLNKNKKDETQNTVQEENKSVKNNELVPKLKGPDDTVIRKDVELKNQTTNENQKSFFDLKTNERMVIGFIVIVSCLFIFGVIRYFLTGKQWKDI